MKISGRSLRALLDTVATLATLVATGVLLWAIMHSPRPSAAERPRPSAAPSTPIPSEPITLSGANLMGNSSASVVIIEYSDFECPYCAKAAKDTVPQVVDTFVKSGRVLFAFRHFPLEKHSFAELAAVAAECAADSGRFWQMHDVLFANQQDLSRQGLLVLAEKIGLSKTKLSQCLDSDAKKTKVRSDSGQGADLQIKGTPTFMFGQQERDGRVRISKVVTGAISAAAVENIVKPMLAGIDK